MNKTTNKQTVRMDYNLVVCYITTLTVNNLIYLLTSIRLHVQYRRLFRRQVGSTNDNYW